MNKQLFEYAILLHPSKSDEKTQLLIPPTLYLAKDEKTVGLYVAKQIPDVDLELVEILIRQFSYYHNGFVIGNSGTSGLTLTAGSGFVTTGNTLHLTNGLTNTGWANCSGITTATSYCASDLLKTN